MTKEDIIYAAGFIDGEGCITTSANNNFRVTVSNTNRDVLIWFQSVFGGNVNNQFLPVNANHNMAWKWVMCSGKSLAEFLDLIIPYLKIKQAEAIIVRDYLFIMCARKSFRLTAAQKQSFVDTKNKLRMLKTDRHYNRI